MICPSCNRGMTEIERNVNLEPNFKLTKWVVCSECGLGAIVSAEFYYYEEPKDEE